MVSCMGDLQVDEAEPEMGEIDGQATNVAYDEDGYEPGILDEIDFEPIEGDSSNGGGGSMSFSDEQPEKLRDGSSADGGSVRAGSIRSSRMSRDSLDIPDAFAFDEESVGHSTSQASSRRSKLSILGHGDRRLTRDSGRERFEPENNSARLAATDREGGVLVDSVVALLSRANHRERPAKQDVEACRRGARAVQNGVSLGADHGAAVREH